MPQPVQPICLPLIVNCPAASNTDLLGGSDEPTIQVQLNTLGGQIYLVPLERTRRQKLAVCTLELATGC